jgi:uncharacterized protein (TIGR00661 family)
MARILYGVSGQGFGHSSRAREILTHLEKGGHDVKVISYGAGYKNLKEDFDVKEVNGLKLIYENNTVNYVKTFVDGFLKAPKTLRSVNKTISLTSKFKPHVVFSDFEPISSAVSNIKRLPLISIDNQHRITNTKIDYPEKYEKSAITTKAIIKAMILNAKAYLVADFVQSKPKNKKTFLFPPILRKEILEAKSQDGDYVLVYLTSVYKDIIENLKGINKKFIIYGLGKDKKIDKNIILKKSSREGFTRDLAGSGGVIANAGLTLMTEALYLGKPYLAVPVKAQFEQVLNAYNLEKEGYGKYWDELNRERVESFLFNEDRYKNNLKKYKKEDNSKILNKIDELLEIY